MEDTQEKKKPHRDRKSGRKAEKKKKKSVHTQEFTDKQRNPKAFTFHSAVRAERQFRRAQDIQTKKQHVPVIDRTPLEPPPIMVVVVGPPKVGKTTLIQCLVKNFTKQPLTAIKGPVTVVSGKRRRITLIECNNDINSMLDLAKVADLVLLLIDASFGFEMEIFEFLNICQVHGMPKVMGVLTHLDMLKNNKTLKRVKKTLKHRFWTEVYAGAKLFYLSGILHGEYLRNEVSNLGRFISVMKFRPLTWQTTHSYVLADRMEDLTPPESMRQNPKVDRTVSLYGFVRGIPLNKTSSVHIPGCGDMRIHDVCFLPDPCPLPEKLKKRSLVEKERLIYAPFSGVGGIVYDKDAVYIELAGSHSHLQSSNKEEPERELVTSLMDTKETLDAKISKSTVKLFSDAAPITASDFIAQSNLKEEPSEQELIGNKRIVFSSDSENFEHSDNESGPAVYRNHADARKKRKRESSNNEENAESSDDTDSEGNVQRKPKKRGSHERKEKDGTERTGGVIARKSFKEEKVVSEDGQTRRKVMFRVSDEDLNAENESSDDEDNDDDVNNDKSDMDDAEGDFDGDNDNSDDDEDNDDDDDYDNIEAKIKQWKSGGQQSGSESSEDLINKKKRKESMKASAATEQVQDVRHHASVTKKDQEVLSKVSNALTKLSNLKQKHSSGKLVDKALSDSAWSEESYGNESGSDTSVNQEQKVTRTSDNETDDDYDSDANNSDENSSADNSDNMDEFNSDGSLEADNSGVPGKDGSDSSLKWKSDIVQKARDSFIERQSHTTNLWKLIYGNEVSVEEDNELLEEEEELGGLFKVISKKQEEKKQLKEIINAVDSSKFISPKLQDWSLEQVRDTIKDCFVTGNWKQSEDANELLRLDDMSDDEMFGDFEDLETSERQSGKEGTKAKSENEEKDDADEKKAIEPLTKAQLLEKKKKLKEKFDAEYDDRDGTGTSNYDEMKQEAAKQAELNRNQFEGLDDAIRVQLEGFRAGMYVRIELNSVPCELVTNFDPTYPIIVGCLQTGEENIGFVKVRIKKHRWYKKILKTKDPIIISLGWRRFQTLPVYSKQEDNMRYRMLKYTPEHVACMAHFWGPLTRPNTGFLAVQDVATKQAGFRIVATGSVVDTNQSTEVTKKLKLTGVPLKIYKKTAFIRGMFNSSLEVAKFEGARIKTVSGIRGQIKKAVNKPEGAFRATFEDKIQLSDIVFCRTWYRVDVPKFYNPVTSLLLPPEQKNLWRGMKTVGQLKRERGMHSEPQLDSMYMPVEREPVVFKPLTVPRKLQKELPYKDKPKFTTKPNRIKRVAVIRDEHESKVASVMRKIRTVYQQKQRENREAALMRLREHRKQVEAENARRLVKGKERKKQFHRALSKKNAKSSSF